MTQNSSFPDKKVISQQTKFIEAVQGLGDILVAQTENKVNSEVLLSLVELRDLLKTLMDLKDKNPQKFDHLMLDKDYWNFLAKNKREAELRLSFYPEKYFVTFEILLKQVIRIFEAATKHENEEIIRHASYELVFFLAKVSSIPQADILVKEILRRILQFARKSVDMKISSVHSTSYEWYLDIVFNKLGQPEKTFQYEYLPLFNQYFFESIKYLVDKGDFAVFKGLIGYLIDGTHVFDHRLNEIWEYDNFLMLQDRDLSLQINSEHHVSSKLNELDKLGDHLYSKDDLDRWILLFGEIRAAIYPRLNTTNKRKANRLEKELKDAIWSKYALRSVIRVMFLACSWAIYRNKSEFIKEVWTHKNPEDAGASYGGADIYPQNLNDSVIFYFGLTLRDGLTTFWEEHHDSGKYEQLYFLLLLSKHLKPIQSSLVIGSQVTDSQDYPDINNFTLPFIGSQELTDAKYTAGSLLTVADSPILIDLMIELELAEDDSSARTLISHKLKPFLQRIIDNSEEKIQRLKSEKPLSQAKINEFKEKVASQYSLLATVRKLFREMNKEVNNVARPSNMDVLLWGYNKIESRELFFEDWYVDFGRYGEEFGRGIADSENSRLVESIVGTLTQVESSNINDLLTETRISNKTVIMASNSYVYDYLENDSRFIPYWRSTEPREPNSHCVGWFKSGRYQIPVYDYHLNNRRDYCAVVNMDKVGKVVIYNPLIPGDNPEDLTGTLRIRVKDFVSSPETLEEFMRTPPDWLVSKGDEAQQKLFLKQHVLLHIGGKVVFVSSRSRNRGAILYLTNQSELNND